jgi:hypothetical protein
MTRVHNGALARYCFGSLSGAPLVHGAFTRLGGASEVGPDVVDALHGAPLALHVLTWDGASEGGRLDLWRANALQLEAVGVEHIECSDLCTCCHRDEFYSHRGGQGHTGRFAAFIGLPARSTLGSTSAR